MKYFGTKRQSMISLLIPTKNRSGFLIRLLRYYYSLGFQGRICIGDSSGAEHVERTKKALKLLEDKLDIVYREYPRTNNAVCVRQLLDFASTPYAVLLPDDDFLIPTALEQCASFLESHPDYSAAHGVGIALALQESVPHGQVVWADYYRQRVIEGESASQRLLDHLNDYSVTLFSVHRVEFWREMYKDVSLLTDDAFALEMLPCCLSVILGKLKGLESLSLVRQSHSQRYPLPGIIDWIARPDWLSSYRVFRNCLANKLSQKDDINIDEAHEVVERAFWSYLINDLRKQISNPVPNHYVLPRWQDVAGMVPSARRVWRVLRSLNLGKRDEISFLSDLLRPSSPYHADFMPVCRAITVATDLSFTR
jgi:glycosyltransferase domain-containing protein